MWILGNDFIARTGGPHFQNIYNDNNSEGYIRSHYDATLIFSGNVSKTLMEFDIIGRVHNNYVQCVNEQILLLKAVIVILEEDILKAANHYKKGTSTVIFPWLDWLVTNLFRITTSYKEKLPTKSRKFKYPQFFWVPAVYHDAFGPTNIYREKFNECLMEVVEKTRGTKILDLPSWDRHDITLCTHGYLNDKGIKKLWTAINDAFQAWDKNQMRKQQFNMRNASPQQRARDRNYDKYHWSRRQDDQPRRKLPRLSDH